MVSLREIIGQILCRLKEMFSWLWGGGANLAAEGIGRCTRSPHPPGYVGGRADESLPPSLGFMKTDLATSRASGYSIK